MRVQKYQIEKRFECERMHGKNVIAERYEIKMLFE